MHFAVYLLLDQELAIQAVLADVAKRPFIMLGMTGLVLLVPLAVTSNARSIRGLGKRWTHVQRLIYVIAICGALHLFLLPRKSCPWSNGSICYRCRYWFCLGLTVCSRSANDTERNLAHLQIQGSLSRAVH